MNMAKFNQLARVVARYYKVSPERVLQATTRFAERLSKDLQRLETYDEYEDDEDIFDGIE